MAERYRRSVDPTAENNPHSYALQLAGAGHRVLEVGCGTGHVTEQLVAAGNRVVGVEIDRDAAAAAASWADRVHVLDLDTEHISSVEDERFDVAILGDVLEHLRDPLPALRDVISLVEPGGRIIISVPNMAHADVRLLLLEGRVVYQDDGLLDRTHLRWFTRESLHDLLTECGLTAVAARRVVIPMAGTDLPVDHAIHSAATRQFVLADPEASTYQFVVECRRSSELSSEEADALAPIPHDWPAHSCEGVGDYIAALENEVDAWRRSRVVRWSRPVRAVARRARRFVTSRRPSGG